MPRRPCYFLTRLASHPRYQVCAISLNLTSAARNQELFRSYLEVLNGREDRRNFLTNWFQVSFNPPATP